MNRIKLIQKKVTIADNNAKNKVFENLQKDYLLGQVCEQYKYNIITIFPLISRILQHNRISVISNKTFTTYVRYLYVLLNNISMLGICIFLKTQSTNFYLQGFTVTKLL